MKVCTKCNVEKSYDKFSNCKRNRIDGKSWWCKQCHKQQKDQWNNNNTTRRKQYDNQYKYQCKLPYWIVYQLPNSDNYVGQTNQPQLRMYNHKLIGRNINNWIELNRCNTLQEALALEAHYHSLGYPGDNASYNRNKIQLETLKTTN